MKSSLMKLNHVSTFSGEGQLETFHLGTRVVNHAFRKKSRSLLTEPIKSSSYITN
jgi:hypothetical protein